MILSFKNKGEIKALLVKQKLRKFIVRSPALQKNVKMSLEKRKSTGIWICIMKDKTPEKELMKVK